MSFIFVSIYKSLRLVVYFVDSVLCHINYIHSSSCEICPHWKPAQEIALFVRPLSRELKNGEGLTPQELFTKEHKELLKEGEEWMKKTAESCMLVSSIIIFLVFTRAFSVQGGYNQHGFPNFLKESLFCSFVVADALTLCVASTSLLIFLSFLMCRYEEEDFRKLLPVRLMWGLVALFFSIAFMMVSFAFSFFLAYRHAHSYIAVPVVVAVLVLGPPILFSKLQYVLVKDVCMSISCPSCCGKARSFISRYL